MYNKKDILLNWFNIFLTIFQLMNFALFMYYVKMILSASEKTDQIPLYFFFLGLLSFFLLVKILLQLGNGYVFNAHKTITDLIFKKISYLNHSGIVMFVANIVLSYAVKDSLAVVFLSLLLILLINMAGWATVLRNHQKFIMSNFFYFILYLCALEIAPIVIIGSYLKD